MPFGLCNAPAVFQNFVNFIFQDLLYISVIVYQDVHTVLQHLREHRLYAKLEKCSVHQQSLPFLGYIVSSTGLQMDPGKVTAIRDWPAPQGLRTLQRFLGFANYYRQFIQDYSLITAPLTALTRKGADVKNWTPEAVAAFTTLKKAFLSAPVLRSPDHTQPFVV
ncbi:uncharacterized protein LOC115462095 [Microcaecilia unicolor]|uniref:Uncharacterized protein LOC115462095 n=1 Tax=Microcaecilia unicolor TaxID=1415580 RepID=A0A6P7XCV4_9AMPH|nr:uncharacterized protein LOC115462095 [Microcaecilia unicolor]